MSTTIDGQSSVDLISDGKPSPNGTTPQQSLPPATASKRGNEAGGFSQIPKIDLLPQEVRDQASVKRVRSRALLGVVGAVAIVIAASAFAFYTSVAAGASLVAEQAMTGTLLEEQAKYTEVNEVKAGTAAVQDAQKVGAWSEIDWRAYLQAVQSTVPAGMTITNVNVDSASAVDPYGQASAPLQGSRVATLTFTASSEAVPQVSQWLDSMVSLPGFVDAAPSAVEAAETGYTVNMTLHVGEAAFSGRYFVPVDPADAAADTATSDGSAK